MDNRYEVRMAGEGGQGLVLAGIILAEAAAIYDGKNAIMTQSYGAQQRGGPSRSEVIISDGEIDYPKVLKSDLLLALTQDAFDRYRNDMRKGGLIIVDSELVERVPHDHTVSLPIMGISREATGRETAGSIVALGIIVELTNVVSHEAITRALMARVPKGSETVNMKALEAGFAAAKKIQATVSNSNKA